MPLLKNKKTYNARTSIVNHSDLLTPYYIIKEKRKVMDSNNPPPFFFFF